MPYYDLCINKRYCQIFSTCVVQVKLYIGWSLKNAMEGSELVYPILSIRKSMFFVSEKNVQKLDKNQIPLAYLFLSEANVTEIIVSKDSDVLADLESGIASVAFQLNQINNTFKRFDFIQSKKSEKINNEAINELKQQHAKVVDHASKENPVLHFGIKDQIKCIRRIIQPRT